MKNTKEPSRLRKAMERSGKPLAKKLALKPGQRAGDKAEVVQAFATTRKELKDALSRAKAALNPGGMIWLTYPKGTSRMKSDINRDSIREYTLAVGLETVALIAVDDDWSAIRCKVA
ncbi:MAG: DUF3052 family protein [Nitrososphaerales archaeon]